MHQLQLHIKILLISHEFLYAVLILICNQTSTTNMNLIIQYFIYLITFFSCITKFIRGWSRTLFFQNR